MQDNLWVNQISNNLQVTLMSIRQLVFRVLPIQVGFKVNNQLLQDKGAVRTTMQTDNPTVVIHLKITHKHQTTMLTTTDMRNKKMMTSSKGEVNITSVSSVNSILSISRMINTVKISHVQVMPR